MKSVIHRSGATLVSQQWRWRLVADNGEPIAGGVEGHASRGGCEHGIRRAQAAGVTTSALRREPREPVVIGHRPAHVARMSERSRGDGPCVVPVASCTLDPAVLTAATAAR
ncbi:DUF1508 domain-containing protein [Tolypothrix campylonemoides VB511288]|nr:DUF1508 domain-containing protein [Tolypothrix campylonemoides VB511288]